MAWSPMDNAALYARSYSFAGTLQSVWEEARRLRALWYDNAVSGDPNFVGAANRVPQDVVDMITLCDALDAFFSNGEVVSADRKSILSRMMRGPIG